VRAYWRQQVGYGRAEALLERKWPERYNRRGHPTWEGRMYDRSSRSLLRPVRIYHGVWGTGAFQPEEASQKTALATIFASPDWYLVLAILAGASLLTPLLPPFRWLALFTLVAAVVTLAYAAAGAWRADFPAVTGRGRRGLLIGLTALLHAIQPAARLVGRVTNGLAPWRRNPGVGIVTPWRQHRSRWHEEWVHAQERVRSIEEGIRRSGGRVTRGGPYDRWDLELLGGIAGAARLLVAVEEHGEGRQLVRCRVWPRAAGFLPWLALALTAITGAAVATQAWTSAALAGVLVGVIVATMLAECGHAVAAALAAFEAAPAPPLIDTGAEMPHVPSVAAMALEEA
jgi:hypothetical protein